MNDEINFNNVMLASTRLAWEWMVNHSDMTKEDIQKAAHLFTPSEHAVGIVAASPRMQQVQVGLPATASVHEVASLVVWMELCERLNRMLNTANSLDK